MALPEQPVPEEISRLARERARAREERDWRLADDLRARIEAAGWKVVDDGTDFTLSPRRPPDIAEPGRVLYGSAESVPLRSETAPDAAASLLVDLGDAPAATMAWLAELPLARAEGLELVVVADGSSLRRDDVVDGLAGALGVRPAEAGAGDPDRRRPGVDEAPQPRGEASEDDPVAEAKAEIVWTSARLTPAGVVAAAARRAGGRIVIVVDPRLRPGRPLLDAVLGALEDPRVAVAGSDGRRSTDLRRFEPAGSGPTTALGAGCYGFRRSELSRRDPEDERLHLAESVAIWWSLLLRDEGPGVPPRLALSVGGGADEPGVEAEPADQERDVPDRAARRDGYRIAARFRDRPDLAGP